MPVFGTPQAGGVFTCLSPGTSVSLVNETIPGNGAPYFSNPISLGLTPAGEIVPFSLFFEWTTTPVGSGAIQLYGSNSQNQPLATSDFAAISAIGVALARGGAFPLPSQSNFCKFRFLMVGFTAPTVANNLQVILQA